MIFHNNSDVHNHLSQHKAHFVSTALPCPDQTDIKIKKDDDRETSSALPSHPTLAWWQTLIEKTKE